MKDLKDLKDRCVGLGLGDQAIHIYTYIRIYIYIYITYVNHLITIVRDKLRLRQLYDVETWPEGPNTQICSMYPKP